MEKMNFRGFKPPVEILKSNRQEWQDYASNIVKEFNINGVYSMMIFKQAKKNKSFLEGKVQLCYEKFGKQYVGNKGNYLISLFRKKKPWEE